MSEKIKCDIKSQVVMNLLIDNGFKLLNSASGVWTLESPEDISNSKARLLVSACINLHKTSKDLLKTQNKYNSIIDLINNINVNR